MPDRYRFVRKARRFDAGILDGFEEKWGKYGDGGAAAYGLSKSLLPRRLYLAFFPLRAIQHLYAAVVPEMLPANAL